MELEVRPRSRTERLLAESLGDELVIYDQDADTAHSLNAAAAAVWRAADGSRTVSELAHELTALGLATADAEQAVRVALDRLNEARLLLRPETGEAHYLGGVSRRAAMKRLAAAGLAAVAIPTVTSLAAPAPAMAASGGGGVPGANCYATDLSVIGYGDANAGAFEAAQSQLHVRAEMYCASRGLGCNYTTFQTGGTTYTHIGGGTIEARIRITQVCCTC